MIEFDKNVPIPNYKRGRQKSEISNRAIIAKMEIGDSYLFRNGLNTMNGVIAKYRGDKKFTCRTVEGGTRVWRIE